MIALQRLESRESYQKWMDNFKRDSGRPAADDAD